MKFSMCSTAATAVVDGFEGVSRRVLRKVPRGDDDRAVLVLHRLEGL